MFRVLAFQPEDKELVKGEEARGTLSIIREIKGVEVREIARFTRDAGGGTDFVDFILEGYHVQETEAGPPQRLEVTLSLQDGKKHSFIAFKEIPVDGAQSVRVTIVKAAMTPGMVFK